MKEILRTEQVTRSFPVAGGNFLALKGISVVVPENTLTILKGRSGSGKTTLLNIIGALDAPTSVHWMHRPREPSRLTGRTFPARATRSGRRSAGMRSVTFSSRSR